VPERNADQNRFLGALLGMAIGDAMGMPVADWTSERIRERYGRIETYHRRVFDDGAEIKAGEFTDESELALCIVESATSNGGTIDPELIGPRMIFLARGEAKRWMHSDSLAALERADESLEFSVPLSDDGPISADVATRGIPIGLLHAVSPIHVAELKQDAERVTRITHGSPIAIDLVTAVALGVAFAARRMDPADWVPAIAEALGGGSVGSAFTQKGADSGSLDAVQVMRSAFEIAIQAASFEAAIFEAVNLGGPADSRGAIAGALAGARFGAEGVPQRLIDDLEGRIYVSLAAPWFYKSAQRRAGQVIDLTPRSDDLPAI
jgi:ADP-ribosyl-[dinitrogen reductase] hydrolase